ncbi:hypothetical protein ANCDUO_23075 [Ancylostoma duodenale]|uniref:Uncharacterized protein n=1 Tax=Ancylostoma duodenale TaxID=51022 RepID=A0A0C2FEB2_9BILA|nr:hypothetical protein ANCDUO_23075 [Ancylostoma duodenale]
MLMVGEAVWMKCRTTTDIQLEWKVYRTMIRPVIPYERECWAATKVTKQILHIMEMRVLRWSMGVTLKDNVSNEVVRFTFIIAPIIDKMREARLR